MKAQFNAETGLLEVLNVSKPLGDHGTDYVRELTESEVESINTNADRAKIYRDSGGTLALVDRPAKPVIVPSSVSARQLRLALNEQDNLSAVETLIAHDDTPDSMKIEWEFAGNFDRDNSTLNAAATLLEWDSSAVDSIFILAKSK